MYKSVLLVLFWLVYAQTIMAQFYAGPNTATLSSEGSQTTTVFETPAMTGRYTSENQELILMVKTGAIPLGASQTDQAMFQDIFIPSANPLLQLKVDLSSVAATAEKQTFSVPASIIWNDQSVEEMVSMTVQQTEKAFVFSLDAPLSLQDFFIKLPAEYADRFSGQIQLKMANASLSQR